jgi:2,4-dienoyl-CoA reductase-like NADH-dependent reductase (Old Yellow Enzyme family)
MYDIKSLFEPIQVKNKILRNRIVMPPMVVNLDLASPEGRDWYGRRAAGGVGMVIVEATSVLRFGLDYTAENLKPLVEAIQQGGALASIQLFPRTPNQSTSPNDLILQDIEKLIDDFDKAAQVCAKAGFDGVEPHGAHGFLLNQFFSPNHNQRTDKYGGALKNRMRLALDIMEKVRHVTSQTGMILLYRHTPVGPGYGISESLVLVKELVKAGLDILDISPASDSAPGDRAIPFMELGIPVIAVNELNHLDRALEVIGEKRADLIAVGRGLIADPEWPNKVRNGRLKEITECISCDQCFDDLRQGVPVGCNQWK